MDMKRFRPRCGGYYFLYVLVVLTLADAVYSFISTMNGTANEYIQSFSMFSYIIAAFAVLYARLYMAAKVEISDKTLHIACLFALRPAKDAKRVSFIFRQGDLDLKLVDKRVELANIVKYGYVEDLGCPGIDQTGARPNSKAFPVHEMAFITNDNKRYHLNIAVYGKKQEQEIISLIAAATGKQPVKKG